MELGVKFRADTDGLVTGIRFYKSAANTGTHIGNLWSRTGTLLASATFTGESNSGWQQVTFTSPVAVTANTTYIASYFTAAGHYAFDQNYFAIAGVDRAPLHALANGLDGGNGVYTYAATSAFPSFSFNATNYWIDVVYVLNGSTGAPSVISTSPASGATGVTIGSAVSATLDEPMDTSTINSSSLQLVDSSGDVAAGTVSYIPAASRVVFNPTTELLSQTTYTVTLKGTVADIFGNPLGNDLTWSFTTAAAPPNAGPGGPILVVSSAQNPFTRYLGEILLNEGMNEFTVQDIATVTTSTLAAYDVVILGDMQLTSTQASMFTSWVNGGGRFVAMHPDKQLASLLGLTSGTGTLGDAYLLVNTAMAPGTGIVGESMQFHGTADLYNLAGATAFAMLYSDASTPTGFPAVTWVNAGAGQAAAFTYDLARSVVYTRQGNPAWSGQDRDGYIDPDVGSEQIRSDDLYYGAASFDPQPDWVDFNKITIPQADEQQRLLVNLIQQMNQNQKPLPRFWYFPSGFKAVVIMTGDDHGNDGTSGRFDQYIASSPARCSVADWTCVRSTSYIFPKTVIPNYLSYVSQGFEIANHADNNPSCTNFSAASLEAAVSSQLAQMATNYPGLPASQTNRTHCVLWSDYDSEPQILLNHGIRLDTSYYYWPPPWVNGRSGLFTGSGMPMRYTDRTGNIFDVYQATTQMPDEDPWNYKPAIDMLLDNALGAQGFYGAFTMNMHTDRAQSTGSDTIVFEAQSRRVPIISSLQMLTWLDGRNSSSFRSLSWNGTTLSFKLTAGTGARNLRAMLPLNSAAGQLTSITIDGNPVSFNTQIIKGVNYAFFSASKGSYVAMYGPSSGPSLSSLALTPAAVVGGKTSLGTVKLNSPALPGGATIDLVSSNPNAAQLPSSVTIAAGATTTTFTVTTTAVSSITSAKITATFGTTKSATLTVTAPVLSSISLNPSSIVGGNISTGTVKLNGVAPAVGTTVSLRSGNSAVAQVPAIANIPAGSTMATFYITTTAVSTNTLVPISGTLAVTKTAQLTVKAPVMSGLKLSPSTLVGGNNSTAIVTLTSAAPAGGAVVSLLSANPAVAQVPTTAAVPAGALTATFRITTSGVSTSTLVQISATLGLTKAANLTVNLAQLNTVTLAPASVSGGQSSTGTVTLSGQAPPVGATILLRSSDSAVAQVPPNVVIAPGTRSSSFTVITKSVTRSTAVTISGSYLSRSRSATLTVN